MNITSLPKLLKIVRIIASQHPAAREIDAAKSSDDASAERAVIGRRIYKWASDTADAAGLSIHVEGRGNIPAEDGFVVVANHQSYADIPTVMYALNGRQIGFVAKDSLEKVPMLGNWVLRTRGLFLKRGDARQALKDLQKGVLLVKKGYNLLIFPEGTRSRGPVMGPFKKGAFHLAVKAKAKILPIVIDGTYHVYEETGSIRRAECTAMILPPVDTASLSREEVVSLEDKMEKAFRSELAERNPEAYAAAGENTAPKENS